MANMNMEQMVDELSGWSVMEVATLVKALETKWGVSAAPAAVAIAAPAGGGAAPAAVEEKTEFDVELSDSGAIYLTVIKTNLAGTLASLGQAQEARAVLDEAHAEALELHDALPTHPVLQQALRDCHLGSARVYRLLGHHREAVDFALDAPYRNRAIWFRVASNYVAQCVVAARADRALGEAEREALCDEYALIALEFARRTGDFGFEQRFLDSLRTGAWAAPLRGRPEFDALVADMEAAITADAGSH
jgi:large subunit ribosomal protein L7/L12